MKSASNSKDMDHLANEHQTLMQHYGKVQSRCSDLVVAQAAELAALRAQAMRLRAAVVIRETALLWEREERMAWQALIPGLPRRLALARRVDQLVGRVHELMRERLHWQWRRAPEPAMTSAVRERLAAEPIETQILPLSKDESMEEVDGFEASLVAADLVICQTGCLSHDAYWRVQDHCKRTGKACVVMAEPHAIRIVRFHTPQAAASPAVGHALLQS